MRGMNCGSGACSCYVQIEGPDYKGMLLGWAKAELLKEKVKAKLDQKYGKELDRLADMIVEVIADEKKERKEDVGSRLRSFFEGGEVI